MDSNVSDTAHEGAFRQIIHRIVASPAVYDLVQRAAGATVIYRRLRSLFVTLPPNTLFLDIGGGTGLVTRHALPPLRYVCLNVDSEKLRGFDDRRSAGVPLRPMAVSYQFVLKA